MATNLQLDDGLIEKALKMGRHRTKKEAVTKALVEYVQHLEQEKIVSLFEKVDYDSAYDYKRQRKKT
jgi:Arc/MetJ family transcription regulator